MLAKRFAIVCFMTMLFGMGFSSLVAQDTHMRSGQHGVFSGGCVTDQDGTCRFDRF